MDRALGPEHTDEFDSLAGELGGFLLVVEAVYVRLGRQDVISAEILHAVVGAFGGAAAHRFGLQHFLVGTGKGMDVEGALAIGNVAHEDLPLVTGRGAHREPRQGDQDDDDWNGLHNLLCQDCAASELVQEGHVGNLVVKSLSTGGRNSHAILVRLD